VVDLEKKDRSLGLSVSVSKLFFFFDQQNLVLKPCFEESPCTVAQLLEHQDKLPDFSKYLSLGVMIDLHTAYFLFLGCLLALQCLLDFKLILLICKCFFLLGRN